MCTVFPTNKLNHPRAIHPNGINRSRATCPNDINHPHAIHPNETVGVVPVCPPERPRSGVSIQEIGFVHHALCAGNERWMRPCRATRAGTQAPPLPRSVIFFHAFHTNKIPFTHNLPQAKSTVHVQSVPTNLHQTTWCAITPSGLYFR